MLSHLPGVPRLHVNRPKACRMVRKHFLRYFAEGKLTYSLKTEYTQILTFFSYTQI